MERGAEMQGGDEPQGKALGGAEGAGEEDAAVICEGDETLVKKAVEAGFQREAVVGVNAFGGGRVRPRLSVLRDEKFGEVAAVVPELQLFGAVELLLGAAFDGCGGALGNVANSERLRRI